MSYVKVLPPKQDEVNAVIKTLYVCEAKGCGWVSERKAKYCEFHTHAADREECEKEYNRLLGIQPAQAPA